MNFPQRVIHAQVVKTPTIRPCHYPDWYGGSRTKVLTPLDLLATRTYIEDSKLRLVFPHAAQDLRTELGRVLDFPVNRRFILLWRACAHFNALGHSWIACSLLGYDCLQLIAV